MKKTKLTALAGIAVAALLLAGCAPAEENTPSLQTTEEAQVDETPTEETQTEEAAPEETLGNIVEVAVGAGSFTTLAAALGAADLVTTLEGEGPFTVFAPTDDAFAALPEGLLDALLLPENVAVLQSILTYHVVSGEVFAADVTTGDVTTVEGSTFMVDTSEGVVINGTANVTATDIAASNGVIHVIDAVIVPASVDLAALLG
ncbi:MAG TPA: fasciclin domain-containing protein [Aquiluna sp.]